jgi:hypothetical protein
MSWSIAEIENSIVVPQVNIETVNNRLFDVLQGDGGTESAL